MKRKKIRFRLIALGVILFPVLIVLLYSLAKLLVGITPEDVLQFAKGNVWVEILIVLVVWALKSVLFFIPVMFLYILVGNLFPPVYAIFINIAGLSVALSLTFWLGKRLGKDFVKKLVRKSQKAQHFMENREKRNTTLFMLRASNIFPVELISLICGCTGYRYFSFLGLSLVAMVPGLIPFTLMGESLKDPLSPGFLIPFGIALVMMAGSLIVYQVKHKNL